MQKITLIAAMAENRVIGANNDIPWHIPEDFAFFKQYTSGKPVIMGRKTWDSLPRKPLPQRQNIVITRQTDWQADGATVCTDLAAALALCGDAAEVMIIGGAQIYAQAMAMATDLRLTEIKLTVAGDTHFPEFSPHEWHEQSREQHISQKGMTFDLVHYSREKNTQAA